MALTDRALELFINVRDAMGRFRERFPRFSALPIIVWLVASLLIVGYIEGTDGCLEY